MKRLIFLLSMVICCTHIYKVEAQLQYMCELQIGEGNWYDINTLQSTLPPKPFNLYGTSDSAFACGNSGIVKFTNSSWRVVYQDPDGMGLRKVKFADDQIGYASGGKSTWHENDGIGYLESSEALLLKSMDGGETWVKMPTIATKEIMDIFLIDADTLYINQLDTGALFKSTDGGVTWKEKFSCIEPLTNFYFKDNWGYIYCGNSVCKTIDYGNHWDTIFYLSPAKYKYNTDWNAIVAYPDFVVRGDTVEILLGDTLIFTNNNFLTTTTTILPFRLRTSGGIYTSPDFSRIKYTPDDAYGNAVGSWWYSDNNYYIDLLYYYSNKYFQHLINPGWYCSSPGMEYNGMIAFSIDIKMNFCDAISAVFSKFTSFSGKETLCVFGLLDNINDISVHDINVYPNPTQGMITVDNKETQIEDITLFDMLGRKLVNKKNNYEKLVEIDLSPFASGIYFLKINERQGAITKKIIKQ